MTTPTVTVGPLLPSQDPRTLEEKILQVQQQNELLSAMRAQSARSGDLQLAHRADALEQQYHVRDVAGVSDDVYESAAHRPSITPGWIRASYAMQQEVAVEGVRRIARHLVAHRA